jgi:hypothetical protein
VVRVALAVDLLGHPGELRVALPHVGLVGAAVEREARVALEVACLQCGVHRPDPELAVPDLGLGPGDARGAVAAERRDGHVLMGLEALAHAFGQLGRLVLEL